MPITRICAADGCEKRSRCKGFCDAHYFRWRRHGDPLEGRIEEGVGADYFDHVIMAHDSDTCLIWPFGMSGDGYGSITYNGERWRVHRLLCTEIHGAPPTPEHDAAHSCGTRACCNLRHVDWKTRADNKADELIHGTRLRGEIHGMAKLTEVQVLRMRALASEGQPREFLASIFGITQHHVYVIVTRRAWKHI